MVCCVYKNSVKIHFQSTVSVLTVSEGCSLPSVDKSSRSESKWKSLEQRQKEKRKKTSCCAKMSVITDHGPRAAPYNLLCPQNQPKTQIRSNTHACTVQIHQHFHSLWFFSWILIFFCFWYPLRAGYCRVDEGIAESLQSAALTQKHLSFQLSVLLFAIFCVEIHVLLFFAKNTWHVCHCFLSFFYLTPPTDAIVHTIKIHTCNIGCFAKNKSLVSRA